MTRKTQPQFDQQYKGLRNHEKLKWLPSLCAVVLIAIRQVALVKAGSRRIIFSQGRVSVLMVLALTSTLAFPMEYLVKLSLRGETLT